jgi:hypothetical protein
LTSHLLIFYSKLQGTLQGFQSKARLRGLCQEDEEFKDLKPMH